MLVVIVTGKVIEPLKVHNHRRAGNRAGFTLVELLIVIAIIGILIGMLLPAVQRVRESGRRTACSNSLRSAALAILSHESARRRFPAGSDKLPKEPSLPSGTEHGWASFILPYLEQSVISSRIDYAARWNAAGGNDAASDARIAEYICPSAIKFYVGKIDFGGIAGTTIVPSGRTEPVNDPSHNGMLFSVDRDHPAPVQGSGVTDGLSRTLLLGEAVDCGLPPAHDVDSESNLRWAHGTSCWPQGQRFVNVFDNTNMRSHHPGGAHGAFADGRLAFLSESMDPDVLAAICTRNGGETLAAAN